MAGDADEERSVAVDVLIGIRALFREKQTGMLTGEVTRLSTDEDIVPHLNSDDEAPWADWKKGDKKGITAEKLARLLKPFGIKSVQRQINNKRFRGF
jgi:hypothetical protein